MKVGYTPTEAYNMFRSLRREVFNYFEYTRPLSFGVRSASTGIFSEGAIAHANFSDDPETPHYWGKPILEHASGIRIDGSYLPYLYEDELRNILLHELTHVTAGLQAGHGRFWMQQCAEVGAVPLDTFLIRNWSQKYGRNHPFYNALAREHRIVGPTMETWKNRTLLTYV